MTSNDSLESAGRSLPRRAWRRLSARQQQLVVLLGALLAIALVLAPFIGPAATAPPRANAAEPRIANIMTPADPRELGMTGLARELESLKRARMEPPTAPAAGPAPELGELKSTLAVLREQIEQYRKDAESRDRLRTVAVPAGTAPAATTGRTGTVPAPPLRIRSIDAGSGGDGRDGPPKAIATPTSAASKPPAAATPAVAVTEPGYYLPSGSLLTGVLIYGLEAATGRQANNDPQPVLVRLKTEAILPSRRHADVRECHVMAACFGALSAERAYCRSTTLSCITDDGGALDTEVQMVAVGSDGKLGLMGRVVSKQGVALRNATLAGFAEGAAHALGNGSGPSFGYGPSGLNPGAIIASSGTGGASSALDRVAQFYIEQAAETQPVIEIDGGREITFATVRGATLNLVGSRK